MTNKTYSVSLRVTNCHLIGEIPAADPSDARQKAVERWRLGLAECVENIDGFSFDVEEVTP